MGYCPSIKFSTGMKTNLLPCPFCGEPAECDSCRGFIDYKGKPGNAVAIYCTKCNADMTLCYGDFPGDTPEQLMEILAENWNRRPSKPQPELVNEWWQIVDSDGYPVGSEHLTLESASYWLHNCLRKDRRKDCKIMHVWKEQEEADLKTLDPV